MFGKSFSLSLFLILSYSFSFGQNTNDNPFIPLQAVGGPAEWDFFVESHLVYPEKAYNQKTEITVALKVFVSEKGELIKFDFINEYPAEFCTESVRLIKLLEWVPAKKNGISVNSEMVLKVEFNPENYRKAIRKRGFSKPKVDKKIATDTGLVIVKYPDRMPEYIKGDNYLNEFISENLEYPELAKRNNIQGIVQLSFVVETNGMISNLKIEKSLNNVCDEAAKEVVRQTKWKPAIHGGKYVRSRFQYAVNFTLNDTFKSNELSEQK